MTRTDHLLFILAEECAEVAQRASKAARFGLDRVHPGQPYTNAELILHEIADLQAAIAMLVTDGVIALPPDMEERATKKRIQVEKYLLLSKEEGRLE